MSFAMFAPEVNSGLMYSGPGSGPLMGAAAAWDELAADLRSTATSFGSTVVNLTNDVWRGPASAAMATATTPYVTWLHSTAAQAEQVGAQAKVAAGAYETAFAAMVPPALIAANRAQLASLVATNLLGQNTPAIAVNEAQYAEMWAQDAHAMDTYAAAAQHAATLPSFTPAPAAAHGLAATSPQSVISSIESAIQGAVPHIHPASLVAPTSVAALEADVAAVQSDVNQVLAPLGGIQGTYYLSLLAYIPGRFAILPFSFLLSLATRAGSLGAVGAVGAAGAAAAPATLLDSVGQFVDSKVQLVSSGLTNQLQTWGQAVTAQLDHATSVGGLSVPHSWSGAAGMARAAPVLPATPVSAPTMSSGLPGGPFAHALLGALSARGITGLASKVPKVIPRSPAGG